MNFDGFKELKTVKQRNEEYYRKQWTAFEALERITEQNEKIKNPTLKGGVCFGLHARPVFWNPEII